MYVHHFTQLLRAFLKFSEIMSYSSVAHLSQFQGHTQTIMAAELSESAPWSVASDAVLHQHPCLIHEVLPAITPPQTGIKPKRLEGHNEQKSASSQ